MAMLKLCVGFLAILGMAVIQDSELYELNIIHFNDFHAHFDEISPGGGACSPAEAEAAACIGGYARLYTAVRQAREAEPDSIVLNAGDTFQGTIWYNFLRWNVSAVFMNLLPHDVHVLGNHEFDHGPEGLLPYLERLNAPMLGANVNASLEPALAQYIQNHVILERRGRRIGVIGVLLRTFSAPMGQVVIEDELEAVNREAAILTELGVDIIILLSHVGFDSDIRLAQRVSPEVDIIVGGHSHTLLFTGETPNGDTALGDYPYVVTRDDGKTIPIVQASCYTRYLGVIKFFIDDEGNVQRWEGQPVFLGTSIVPDPDIVALLDPWREEVDAVGKEVLGRSLVTLNNSGCRRRECNLGSFVCDGFLDEMVRRARGTNWTDAHVCMVNAGGLRMQINPGDVTTEGLLMAMPFENYVQVYDLQGRYLLEALEYSVSASTSDPVEFNSGRLVQIGGMRNVYNLSLSVNSRVASAMVRCIECDVPRYEPLDVDKMYRVLTQDYIGDGGSGFTMLAEHRENVETLQVDYQMLQNYMRRTKIAFQDLDGRIQIVN